MRKPKQRKPNDLNRSLTPPDVNRTLIAVVELSQSTWLVGAIVPCIERDPLKRLTPPDPEWLLKLLYRWRDEAIKAGKMIERIVVGYEAGRDGFWLARWLLARGIEAYVMYPTSIAVFPASIGARRPTGWISGCSSAPYSVGCAAKKNTAVW